MLGFRQLRQKIAQLDYSSWSAILKIIQRFEAYIKEAKMLKDGNALEEAFSILDSWIIATNETTKQEQALAPHLRNHVRVTNLTRLIATLQWLKRLF